MFLDVPSAEELPPLSTEELSALPVFPLPKMVFFPGSALPLHLFEPRYREMIIDCTTKGPKAMAVTLLLPGHEAQYQGQPPIAPVSGVGRIVWHEALDDGRHNVVLVGLGRARLEELPMEGRSYRRARATMLPDEGAARGPDVSGLLSCASAISAVVQKTHPDFSLGLDESANPGQVADAIADRLVADARDRQAILEALDVHQRIERVTSALSDLLAEIQRAKADGPVNLKELGRVPRSALAPGELTRLTHPPYDILVTNVSGQYFAMEDACPHSGQSLCTGRIEEHVVICPGHGWKIDVRTGDVLTEVGSGRSNPTFEVRVEGDDVVVYSASSSARS